MSGGRRAARFANDVTRPRRRLRVSPCCERIFSGTRRATRYRGQDLRRKLPRIHETRFFIARSRAYVCQRHFFSGSVPRRCADNAPIPRRRALAPRAYIAMLRCKSYVRTIRAVLTIRFQSSFRVIKIATPFSRYIVARA